MEYWRQCALWLIRCKVLPPNHRVTWESAQAFDLAQTLRDGVLLCQLLNNLRPQSINLKEINLRPQMSQFLCLKNIRTFLSACCEIFAMKKSELFEAFDLFDVRDFAKNSVEDEEDLYDCVYGDDEGGEVYEDLMKTEVPSLPKQAETDIRNCCLTEIKQTEEKYTETLESIEKYFMNPLRKFVSAAEIEKVFVNIPVSDAFGSLMQEVQDSIVNKNAQNIHEIFITYKQRLLIYGVYCSRVEIAISVLDCICKEKEDVRLKLEECSKRANNGRFTLRDLLVVPMQRVLKYHLLLQELVKHTHDAIDKSNLRMALDAMKDLAQYVNEVKRDTETLREIEQYQSSIENLNQPLVSYGRPKGDGEVRVATVDKRAKQDRHIFLFDVAVIVCKRRGDNYEMKEVIDLNYFKITNNPTTDRENRKWSYGFYLTHQQGHSGFEQRNCFCTLVHLGFSLLRRSNIRPEEANSNWHEFKMHTFDEIASCSSCRMLLRGIFNQGYLCSKCGVGAHKECLGRFGNCGKTSPGATWQQHQQKKKNKLIKNMLVIRDYYGVPSPSRGPPLNIHIGDIVELVGADIHSSWWEGKIPATGEIGFFPSDNVKPCPCVSINFSVIFQFAGPIERPQAEAELIDRENSTYLVRHRSKEFAEYAISIKYNNEVKHIKILNKDGVFYIAENRKFKSILELIEYYQQNSLKEGFRTLDTALLFPYRALLLTPRVTGIAIARYDYSARDTRELSLAEDDVVKIYTKLGANGWWKGEVNGRVGWFPSTYVEELE
uniref:Vav 3 guanine nucleotide exchange factor b n=1 Tax=Scleropages formosus TaxID=113540 RepID=A0A8C9VEW1_SCLFO